MENINIPPDILELVAATIRTSGNKYFLGDGQKYYRLNHSNGYVYEMDGDDRPEGVRIWRSGRIIGTIIKN